MATGVPPLRGPGRPESAAGQLSRQRGSGCRACRGPDVIPPAEGGNLGSETKRHQTAARPQISSSQARRASPPPAGRPLPSSPGPGAGGWGTQQQASCPPSPAPRRNALGVKLMRKQRLPSQRPGNPAMERPPVPHPGPLPLPAFRNSSRGSPFTRLLCVRRDEEMPCGCVVSCPSSPNPAWTHLVRLPRRVGERGVRGPQPQAALALPPPPRTQSRRDCLQALASPQGTRLGPGTHSRDLLPSSGCNRVLTCVLATWQATGPLACPGGPEGLGPGAGASRPARQLWSLLHKQLPSSITSVSLRVPWSTGTVRAGGRASITAAVTQTGPTRRGEAE